MADQKSRIPDMGEIASMAGKLFKDVKESISEIIEDYKSNHPQTPIEEPEKKRAKSTAEKPAEKPSCSIEPDESKPKESKSEDIKK